MGKYFETPKSPEAVGKLFNEISKISNIANQCWRNQEFKELFQCIDMINEALSCLSEEGSQFSSEVSAWIHDNPIPKIIKGNGK